MTRIMSQRESMAISRECRAFKAAKDDDFVSGFYGGWIAGIAWWQENQPLPDETPALPFPAEGPSLVRVYGGGAVEEARRAFYLAAREWIRCARLSDEKADDETDEQMDELAGTTARSFDKVDETYDALVKAEADRGEGAK